MFYRNTYKNWETVQRLACHYDLFSQMKVLSKRMFFCSIAASGTLREDEVVFIVAGDINSP
jgi:hypothetical protein